MAQAFYCRVCNASYSAELRGKSCPACGEELIHGRVPSGRAAPKRRAGSGIGRAVWDYILKRDPCAYCKAKLPPKEITIDHIHPKALGGAKSAWTNRTASCQPCNGRKAHTPLLFFMLEENKGVDLSRFKDEDGNWPIPETPEQEALRLQAEIEAELALLPILSPRRLLAEQLS